MEVFDFPIEPPTFDGDPFDYIIGEEWVIDTLVVYNLWDNEFYNVIYNIYCVLVIYNLSWNNHAWLE